MTKTLGMGVEASSHMPRTIVPLNSHFPYHVTARSVNRESFSLSIEETWQLMEDYLFLIQKMYDLEIISFVLMPNHFHLIVRTPKLNLDKAMNYFMREVSKEMNRRSGRINQTFGGRYHKSLIASEHYFKNVYKYVYRNPVRARLTNKVEAYPYSTLHGLCGQRPLFIPLLEDTQLFDSLFSESTLRWLNTDSKSAHEIEIKKALKKPIFELSAQASTKRSELESLLI